MKKLLYFSFLVAPALALADLGQNELQVAGTYGPPINEQKIADTLVVRQYVFNGLHVAVTFLNGASQGEVFQKADGSALAETQIEKILAANANRLEWTAKGPAALNAREWLIAGPKAAAPETADAPAVFAVAGKRAALSGEKMIAVDMLQPESDAASAPAAPPVLRRAVYTRETTNHVMKVFTAAYENVAKQEQRRANPVPPAP